MKIRQKMLLGFLPIALLSVGVMTLFANRVVEQVLVQEVTRRGLSISLNLAKSRETALSFQTGDEGRLLPMLQQIRENAGAQYAMVLDSAGLVLAHTNVVEKGKQYRDAATLRSIETEDPEHFLIEVDGRPVIDVSFPVWEFEEQAAGEEFLLLGKREVRARRRLGTVRLGLSLTDALDTANRISAQVLWIITLVSILTMGLILFYMRALLRPVRFLAEAAERIGRGEVGEEVPVLSGDEMGDLAASFNRMSQDLAVTTVSRNFLDSVLRNMQDILLVTNADGTIRLLNQRVGDLLGYEEERLNGQPVGLLFSEEEDPFAPEGLVSRGAGAIHSLETELITRVGETVSVLLGVTPFVGRELQVEGFVFTATDITERKRSEEQIRASLEEKELLLKEIHHRVKNNLQVISSLLSLQARQIQDEQAQEMFNNSQDRVMSMALIHEKLYRSDELARVNFTDYLRDLTDNLFQSYQIDSQRIQLQLEVENILLAIDEAIPCGLIINELILNSLKHAFPGGREGMIYIYLGQREEDDQYQLVVRDDGVGLPADLDLARVDTLGLKLVNILVMQLKGHIDVSSAPGAKFSISFGNRD